MSFEEVQLWIAEGKRDGWDYLLHGYDYSTKEYFHAYASVADLGTVVKKYDQHPYRLDETVPISEAVIEEERIRYRQKREHWLAEGQRNGSDYMFVIHDSFSHDEYHDYSSIADFDLIQEKYSHQDIDMQWISEIIALTPAAKEHQKSIEKKRG
jgi:hypothetical protein